MNLHEFDLMVEYYKLIVSIHGYKGALLVDPTGILCYMATNKLTLKKRINMLILYEEYKRHGLIN